jgi:hypothetical protein
LARGSPGTLALLVSFVELLDTTKPPWVFRPGIRPAVLRCGPLATDIRPRETARNGTTAAGGDFTRAYSPRGRISVADGPLLRNPERRAFGDPRTSFLLFATETRGVESGLVTA